MMRPIPLVFTLLILPGTGYAESNTGARLSLGGGLIDLRTSTATTWQLALEGGGLSRLWDMRPALLAIDGGDSSRYLGVGLLKEFPLNHHWRFGIGAAAGHYHQGDSTRNLGKDFEFHTRILFDFQTSAKQRLRLEVGHLSNAYLSSHNPGTELITLNWVHHFY